MTFTVSGRNITFPIETSSLGDSTQSPQSGILEPERISSIRLGSCSRRNVAAKLVVALFDEETRQRSNVGGRLTKSSVNPVCQISGLSALSNREL